MSIFGRQSYKLPEHPPCTVRFSADDIPWSLNTVHFQPPQVADRAGERNCRGCTTPIIVTDTPRTPPVRELNPMHTPENACADIDLEALARNCAHLRSLLPDHGKLCAVVKADGYGHGLLAAASAAIAGGASWIGVASIAEARRVSTVTDAHDDVRILVLGPVDIFDFEEAIVCGYELVVWDEQAVNDVNALAASLDDHKGRVHVKFDTGMGRLGTRDSAQATRAAEAAAAAERVELVGLMTHFATADLPEDPFFEQQLQRFTDWATPLKRAHPDVLVHAANSAATLRDPAAHFDMVRCGVAIYGLDPFGVNPFAHNLQPVLTLGARLAEVRLCRAGESTGYGRRFTAPADTHLGLLAIGYGDGWRRALSGAADALIGATRYPLVGTISMDTVAVNLGPDPAACELLGERAVLIGAEGDERILAEDIARTLHTINYEITCGLGARIDRYHRGAPDIRAAIAHHEWLERKLLLL